MENQSRNGSNEEKQQKSHCYCGKERNLNIIELSCQICERWFHESCIGYQLGKGLPFCMNYTFLCKNCSPTGLESYKRTQASIPQILFTTIANLQQASAKEGSNKIVFSKDKEIIPFIENYWESLTTLSRRIIQTPSWTNTIHKALINNSTLFYCDAEKSSENLWGLKHSHLDLTKIKPNFNESTNGNQNTSKLGRQPKRKLPTASEQNSGPTGKKGRPNSDLNTLVKLPAHGYPLEHPFNKDGYRYILAEPDPHAPFRQEFDESSDWAGKPIPGWLYRVLVPNSILIALHDRAPQLKISEDRLSVTGEKGYCMARCTHFVTRGVWYYEATIEEMPEGSATRIGFGQSYANLQAPLGYDKFGYSWRSRKGTKFHESHGKHYSCGYGEGDTLGFLIVLPEADGAKYLPNTYKERPLVKFKSHLYYEDKDKVNDTLKSLRMLPDSKIYFFKNGECQGLAFEGIHKGAYYPTISLHKSATVSVNFGPNFKHPNVLQEFKARPFYERVEEFICEQSMADMNYFIENDGRLSLQNL